VPQDPQAIADAMVFALTHPEVTRHWVSEGKKTAQQYRASGRAQAFADWLETLL